MGIKENFSQAVRELTGGGAKDERRSDKSTVDGMRNAVAAEDTSEFMAVTDNMVEAQNSNNAVDDFEEIERRAARAAENYNRQQDAFAQGEYPEKNPFDAAFERANAAAQADNRPRPQMFGAEQNTEEPETVEQLYAKQQAAQQAQQQTPLYTPPQQNTQAPPPVPPQPPVFGGFQQPSPAPQPPASYYQQADDNETTVISRNTVIDGNVRSFANMSIDGNIKGNVETTKDIDLNGKIVGNIACNNASLRTSQIQGNIQMKGNAFMERDTLLIGDLTSTYANVNGKIKGNLAITGKAELKSDAVVFGDISASTITVNDGAIIQGYVSTTFLNKEESKSIFPDAITIGE